MLRLGLCCLFVEAPIHFRTTTAAYLMRLQERGGDVMAYLATIIADNVKSLCDSITYCKQHGIGCFRVNSRFFPLITHPNFSYAFDSLSKDIHISLAACKQAAAEADIRLTFHPDQFVVVNSPIEKVVKNSIAELEWHGKLAEAIGADVINIHAGGAYGDKVEALNRLMVNTSHLSSKVLLRLTIENDDKIYTPSDLLPVCRKLGIPFVYDVHHHRCHPDSLSIEEATQLSLQLWNREPLFHISSPREGWNGSKPTRHHDYIDASDFPKEWTKMDITVEVEAKAKEKAILKLKEDLLKS